MAVCECGKMDVVDRLLSKMITIPETGCWWWIGSVDSKGYGYIGYNKKVWRCHRVSYTVFRGDIPAGMMVLHVCDNPCCINPDHLTLGTNKDNMRDMVNKKRQCRGSDKWQVKLSENDVRDIRASDSSYRQLAEEYGVHHSSIWAIVTRKKWRHI